MRAARFIARFDSASASLQAVASYLHGKDFTGLGIFRWSRGVVPLVNRLPPAWRQRLYRLGAWREGVPPAHLGRLRSEALAQWAVRQYPRRQYPAIMLGSSNGAAVHLCCALGIPWLPQTLLVPVRRPRTHPDDIGYVVEATRDLAQELLQANPDLLLHQMHDPNQDRLMCQEMAYFRVKRRALGATYQQFIEETLLPGGTLLLLECHLPWPTTQLAERHVFQLGGLGGLPAEEYLSGSKRVAAFLRRMGSPYQRWAPPAPDGERPEAEWGFAPELREAVASLARRQGYRLQRLSFQHPQDFSPFVADLYRWWYGQQGVPGQRLVGESFALLDPWWPLHTGSVPYWTFFAVEPAAAQLEHYLRTTEPYDDIYLTLFSHGIESIGIAPVARWRSVLAHARQQRGFLGVDEAAFPRDFAVFVRYYSALRQLPAVAPPSMPLSLEQLETFVQQAGHRYAVTCHGFPSPEQPRCFGARSAAPHWLENGPA
jgi:hypothetical protein